MRMGAADQSASTAEEVLMQSAEASNRLAREVMGAPIPPMQPMPSPPKQASTDCRFCGSSGDPDGHGNCRGCGAKR